MFNFIKNWFGGNKQSAPVVPLHPTKQAPVTTLKLASHGQAAPPQHEYLIGAWKAEQGYTVSGFASAMFPVAKHGETMDETFAKLLNTVTEQLGRGDLICVDESATGTKNPPGARTSRQAQMVRMAAEAGLDIAGAKEKATKQDIYPSGHVERVYITEDHQVLVSLEVHFGYPMRDTDVQYSQVSAHMFGFETDVLDPVVDAVTEMSEDVPVPKKLKVNFWMMTRMGPANMQRQLDVPKWDDIKDAYPADVEKAASQVMIQPKRGSGVMLWHGPPGTGKTTAIRSLMQEWVDWGATVHLISDPEKMLNDASYLTEVMSYTQRRIGENTPPVLIVLEDSGELITSDAKSNAGQALSRLLNMTDGILGQNENIYVLITTNEPLSSLHDAVTRPGRCISNIDFHKLTPSDIAEWCKKNDVAYEDGYSGLKEATLAELYSIKDGFGVVTNLVDVTEGIASKSDAKEASLVAVEETMAEELPEEPVDSPAPEAEDASSPLAAAADALDALAETVSPEVLEQVTRGTDTQSSDSSSD